MSTAFSIDTIPIVKQLKEKEKTNTISDSEKTLLKLLNDKFESLKNIAQEQQALITSIAPLKVKVDSGTATPEEQALYKEQTSKLVQLKSDMSVRQDQAISYLVEEIKKEALKKKLEELKKFADPNASGVLQTFNPENYRDFLLSTIGLSQYDRDTAANDSFRNMLLIINSDLTSLKSNIQTKQSKVKK